jgi:plasmid stabilization system protein ParE
LDAAKEAFELLADNPALGAFRIFSNKLIPPTRAWPIGGFENYVIYYRESENGIVILRLLQGSRNAERELSG